MRNRKMNPASSQSVGTCCSLPRPNVAHSTIVSSWQHVHGTHHGVRADHLDHYLDEFVFRFNRRCYPMARFATLLGLGAAQLPTPIECILSPLSDGIFPDQRVWWNGTVLESNRRFEGGSELRRHRGRQGGSDAGTAACRTSPAGRSDRDRPRRSTWRRRPESPSTAPADPGHPRAGGPVSYTHLRAHETRHDLVCRLL